MSAGGPSFDDRLQSLACVLAAAHDIAAVVSVRTGIMALIRESGDALDQLDFRRRARDLRRQAEIIVGELLILMAERGERRGNGGDQRTPPGRSRTSIADLGFRWRTTTSRWQRRARAAPVRSFNVRLAEACTIEAITALIAEANAEGRACLRAKDHAGHRITIARRMSAKRRGAIMLLAGGDPAAVAPASARRWARLARLSDSDFRAAVESGNEGPGHRAPTPPAQHVVMVTTPFRINERGNLHRQAFAVDDPAAAGFAAESPPA